MDKPISNRIAIALEAVSRVKATSSMSETEMLLLTATIDDIIAEVRDTQILKH